MRIGPRPQEEKRANNKGKRSRHVQYTDQIGRSREKTAMAALSEGPLPAWIKSYRRAKLQEDIEGKDLVIETDFGEVYIQIKSSAEGCQRYREKQRGFEVEVVMIKPIDRLDFVRHSLILAAEKLRDRLMRRQRGSRRSG